MIGSQQAKGIMLLSIACYLLSSADGRAAIIERDLRTPGDGLLTFDEVHNREWLDLTETAGLGWDSILGAIAPGGELFGFSLATIKDVEQLVESAALQETEPWIIPGVAGSEPKEFVDLLGEKTLPVPIRSFLGDGVAIRFSYGNVVQVDQSEDDTPIIENEVFYVMSFENSGPVPGGINRPLALIGNSGGFFVAPQLDPEAMDESPYWLYRSVVPEPSSSILILLAGLLIWHRRGVKIENNTTWSSI